MRKIISIILVGVFMQGCTGLQTVPETRTIHKLPANEAFIVVPEDYSLETPHGTAIKVLKGEYALKGMVGEMVCFKTSPPGMYYIPIIGLFTVISDINRGEVPSIWICIDKEEKAFIRTFNNFKPFVSIPSDFQYQLKQLTKEEIEWKNR